MTKRTTLLDGLLTVLTVLLVLSFLTSPEITAPEYAEWQPREAHYYGGGIDQYSYPALGYSGGYAGPYGCYGYCPVPTFGGVMTP